ncbi:RNA-binding RNA annealing protein [Saxophila tyrrhenica]|uniref:RNA-binding RNA annealing protein n=1 Tax=Saxophila tyrrhenica TaxID=1690608 RepID=A0AAV9P034_9PEZI|nr:RNA-binding RNA annealing protein [Saxophila tyrrhenica]
MSGKLDQSLDQIMQDTKPTGGRNARRGPKPRNAKSKAKAAIAAPTGGVQKSRPVAKGPAMVAVKTTRALDLESKVIVSNLPEDVTEGQIKRKHANLHFRVTGKL